MRIVLDVVPRHGTFVPLHIESDKDDLALQIHLTIEDAEGLIRKLETGLERAKDNYKQWKKDTGPS